MESMALKDAKVFVTGGNGFIGSWLVKHLLEEGAHVTCLIKEELPACLFTKEGMERKVTVVHGILEDGNLIEKTIAEVHFDYVYHLAAQAIVGIANKEPVETFETNIRGTWHLLDACRKYSGMKAIMIASSDKAYGSHTILPYKEDCALHGEHPYDGSKSCEDLIAQLYAKTYGMPIGNLRCGNVYGGGDSNISRIVHGVCLWLQRDEPTIIRSNGRFIRDYVYVEDVVDAYIAVAQTLAEGKYWSEAWNISNEEPLSVIEITNQLIAISGKQAQVEIRNEAFGEIKEQYLSSEKIRHLLKWRSKWSMEEGLKKTYAWYAANPLY